MSDQTDTPSPEMLAQLLEGRSDEEIYAFVSAANPANLLDTIFSAMVERFRPDQAAGQAAVIQWNITLPDGVQSRQIQVADGVATATSQLDETASATMTLGMPDFLRLITGQLDGIQAFMGGALRIDGDITRAQQIQTWFGR